MPQFLGDDYDDDEQKLFEAISFYQRAKGRSLLEEEEQYNTRSSPGGLGLPAGNQRIQAPGSVLAN